MRRWLPPLAVLVALIGIWELAARWDVIADALSIEPFLVPAPSEEELAFGRVLENFVA